MQDPLPTTVLPLSETLYQLLCMQSEVILLGDSPAIFYSLHLLPGIYVLGSCVDNIESNVETAAVRVDEGNKQLETAVRHKVCTCPHVCPLEVKGTEGGVAMANLIALFWKLHQP